MDKLYVKITLRKPMEQGAPWEQRIMVLQNGVYIKNTATHPASLNEIVTKAPQVVAGVVEEARLTLGRSQSPDHTT